MANVPLNPPQGVADLVRMLCHAQELTDADLLEVAHAECSVVVDTARRWQIPPTLAAALSLRSVIARLLGWLRVSADDASTAGAVLAELDADRHGDPALRLFARHVMTLVDLGEYAAADALLGDAGLADELPDTRDGVVLRFARGRLHAAAGRPAAALPDLFHCGERLAAWNADRPGLLPWRSAAAAALWHSGAREAAARLADAEVGLARRTGTAGVLGCSLRVHGMVSSGPAGLPALEESVRMLQDSPRCLELALTLVEYGTRLNELKRRPQARRVVRTGLDLAERCGATGLVERARVQYAAAGGRLRPMLPTGASGLTAAERRAATLAAADRTNRQIAEELFLSVRTIEIHLTNAYRKLGVSRRSELPAALDGAESS